MTHPYADLPPDAFWKTGVTQADRDAFPGLYRPAFAITPDTRVATAGSCFAQHIARHLRRAGVQVLDAEPAPRAMPEDVQHRFGYGLFSGRYGNIYTARQMLQLLREVADDAADQRHVWRLGDRFVDALRPTVEPDGIDTIEEVLLHRNYHLARTAMMLAQADVFVFTLGLTEGWACRDTGRVYPVCPGVAGGNFDPQAHVFVNFRFAEVLADLQEIQVQLRRFNPAMALLLTVSPVPLTATATGRHVLDATTQAKATLRAAAAEFVAGTTDAAYFPSYEIVTHPASGGPWFERNLRSVSADGVEKVMGIFLDAHGLLDVPLAEGTTPDPEDEGEADDLVCDELLLQSFAR